VKPFKWLAVVLLLGMLTTACSSLAQPATAAVPSTAAGVPPTTKPTKPQAATAVVPPIKPGALETNPAEAFTRTDVQGAVTVGITPQNLQDYGETLDFDIVLDTHSVDLSMDLAALATLSTDAGRSVQPLKWDGGRGGHHVSGTLSFPARVDGAALLDGAATLTLVLKDVDAPERVFVWELSR
jgi:hypothetical protein